ncbi:MAG TPA: restriction endonuclease [Thermoanaerobaculia bacterium]|nr:restriction endonuclease [Thermoanaerobaculia bacterium]
MSLGIKPPFEALTQGDLGGLSVDLLFTRYRQDLMALAARFARSSRSALEPAELLSMMYLRIKSANPGDVSRIRNVPAYCSSVLHNLVSDEFRAQHSGKHSADKRISIDELDLSDLGLESQATENRLHLEKALLNLYEENSHLSKAITLRYLYNFNLAKVAENLKESPSKAERSLRQARRRLRSLLQTERELQSQISPPPSPTTELLQAPPELYRLELVDAALIARLAKEPELLRTLNWRAFEHLLSKILEELEYEVELTRSTRDGGVDIFALRRSGPFGPHRYLLQAKRWSKAVGVEPVRELLFLHQHHRVTKSCLATTSRFTGGAWELAREYQWALELRDYEGLLEWIKLCVQPHSELIA